MPQIKVKCPAKTTSALDEQSESLEMRRPELVSRSHQLRVACPAKINLTLEILNKREDGFHNIQSVMQTIDLFDILTIKIEESKNSNIVVQSKHDLKQESRLGLPTQQQQNGDALIAGRFSIKLTGTSDEIPYDERNLVYKAAKLFFESSDHHSPITVHIHIEKNIPIAAGLAGGSTDAAGTLWGLNKLFNNILSEKELHELCAQLGSDLNFCLEGGCQLATSRGEILEKLPFQEFSLSLIKPKNLGISAKEAYTKFSELNNKPNLNMTEKLVKALKKGDADLDDFLQNDLEFALVEDYKELRAIRMEYPEALMSGSGSTFFAIETEFKDFDDTFWIKSGLKSIPHGICEK